MTQQSSSSSAQQPLQAPATFSYAAPPAGYQYALVPTSVTAPFSSASLPPTPAMQGGNQGRRATRRGGRGRGRAQPQGFPSGVAYSGNTTQVARTGMTGVTSTTMGAIAPSQHKKASTPGGLRLKGKEMLWKVLNTNNTGDWWCDYKGINPTTYPWLNAFAQNYEQFFFHSIRLSWQPAFASANGTLGFCIDTDISDRRAQTLAEALKNQCSVAGLVCANMSCEYYGFMAVNQRLFIKSGETLNHQGMVEVFYEGIGEQLSFGLKNGSPLGYLYAEYDVELFVPQGSS